jgi:hypothetical protein
MWFAAYGLLFESDKRTISISHFVSNRLKSQTHKGFLPAWLFRIVLGCGMKYRHT